jgi:LytS/YehU family sensor histidine kinase
MPERLSLAYNNNYLTFQFVGTTIQSPGKVRYQYMLEGLEDNWNALTNRSEASYGNLPHGHYTFKVKAVNSDGYWSKEYHYNVTIRPPWWHTWWAYTIFALTLIGVIYTLFRYRLNKVRRDHEMKQKTAELEMQALRAQMNPHFIFNSLNSINLFILENNKLQASEYLTKFSRLVRLILNNSREPLIPLERELEALQLYLELESLRFEQRFNYKITVDKNIDTSALKVPPLIIQPYAENAIWHGLMPKKEGGNLDISLYQQEHILVCKITDDGIGRKKAAEYKSKSSSGNKSMGMRITSDRIAILQNQDLGNSYITINDLVLPDGSPGGTEVLLQIPATYN